MQSNIKEKIYKLKEERNAIILAHNYQIGEIQDIADLVGDSFALSKKAKQSDCDVIVFCGVRFMGESAKILSPNKTVLMPVECAGCPMADMVTVEDIERLRNKYPDAAVVCYINSSADVKAASDICCTSSNAVKVVKSLPNDKIIFVPDQNLGSYVAKFVPEKQIILFDGYCPVHKNITADEVDEAKNAVKDAKFLVHPECTSDVVNRADFIGSTAQIINYVSNSNDKKFIIGTEQGVIHWLNKYNPDKEFHLLSQNLICHNMKKIGIEDVLNSLENMVYEINMESDIINKASNALNKMLNI